MNIYVDADACPMNDIIIKHSAYNSIPLCLVKSYAHFSLDHYPDHVKTLYVDSANEAADYKILSLVKHGDLVVTQDYGLAALALEKNCIVIHPKGFQYTKDNIDQLLTSRYQSAQARKKGIRTKGPKPLTDHDRDLFTNLFVKIIQSVNR